MYNNMSFRFSISWSDPFLRYWRSKFEVFQNCPKFCTFLACTIFWGRAPKFSQLYYEIEPTSNYVANDIGSKTAGYCGTGRPKNQQNSHKFLHQVHSRQKTLSSLLPVQVPSDHQCGLECRRPWIKPNTSRYDASALWLGIPVYSGNFSQNMRAALVQNMWEKCAEFGEICAKICCIYAAHILHICGITEICGVNDACACVYVGQNVQKCWKMRLHMRKYAIICKFLQNYA